MWFNKPKFERPEPTVIGPASDETKESVKRLILERFGEKHLEQLSEEDREKLESSELKKEPYEKLVIERANKITNELLRDAGQSPFEIPERNIHDIPNRLFEKLEDDGDTRAVTYSDQQSIFINSDKIRNPIDRSATILHEMTHLKSFLSLEVHEDDLFIHRAGLKVAPTRKKREDLGYYNSFTGLNEAVVTEMEKTYLTQLLEFNKFIRNEKEWESSEEALKTKGDIAKEKNMDPEEIICLTKIEGGYEYKIFPYPAQRKVLHHTVNKIFEDNRKKFKSENEVMKLFFNAHFNGQLIEIGRLIEKSFGEGSFRIVGMMDDDSKSANRVMDYLKKYKKKNQTNAEELKEIGK